MMRLLGKLGIDSRAASGIAARLVPMMAGPLTSLIIVWCLTAETQGLFYLFGSLLALRILFDLGAGTSVIQIAAHARNLTEGDRDSKLQTAFVHVVNSLFNRLSLIYSVLTAAGGIWFLAVKGHGDAATLSAWVFFVIVSGLQFASEGRWGLLSGADLIPEVCKLRIQTTMIQNVVQWGLLVCGAGLFAFCTGALAGYMFQEMAFRKKHTWLYYRDDHGPLNTRAHFSDELKTLIKRSSQTYLTGYFVFQIQQPICFHLLGAEASAKLGLTQSVGGALLGLPGVLLAVNFPVLAHKIADGHLAEARRLFLGKWLQVAVFSIAGFAMGGLAVGLMQNFPKISARLLSLPEALVLFLSLMIQGIALAGTYWPRAFKLEPFVSVAYTQMFVTPVLIYWFAYQFGLMGVSLALLCSWLLGAGGIGMIVSKFLKPNLEILTPI